MTVILDGTKPLWADRRKYIFFLNDHEDEIYERYLDDDENAELIVDIIDQKDVKTDAMAMTVLMIATERYISMYHPEIAVIQAKG